MKSLCDVITSINTCVDFIVDERQCLKSIFQALLEFYDSTNMGDCIDSVAISRIADAVVEKNIPSYDEYVSCTGDSFEGSLYKGLLWGDIATGCYILGCFKCKNVKAITPFLMFILDGGSKASWLRLFINCEG